MASRKRHWVHPDSGSYHLISRTVGQAFLLSSLEKDYFVKLMFKLAKGFYIDIHAFAVMSNHFHILATGLYETALQADRKTLLTRYKSMYGRTADPPEGSYRNNGELIPDEDGGIERLRNRLGSVSDFIKELKQGFSRWYNRRHKRKGYLWSDRYQSVIIEKGDPELICSAYIDLNAVRAGIVQRPEDYRWCSIGMMVRNPRKAMALFKPVKLAEGKWNLSDHVANGDTQSRMERVIKPIDMCLYRGFLYTSGCRKCSGKGSIPESVYSEAMRLNGRLGLGARLSYRFRNLSEGVALGSADFIRTIQRDMARKYLRPRRVLKQGDWNGISEPNRQFYATRCLTPI